MSEARPFYADRVAAGRELAEALAARGYEDPIVYALPRGGVPLAVEAARRLKAPLDLVLVRKIGAPGSPELALAAVTDGAEPQTVVNRDVAAATGASDAYLDEARRAALAEIERRRKLFLGARPRPQVKGRTAIIVDDGLATGATARAAAAALKAQGAARVVVAAPVAPPDTAELMEAEGCEVLALARPAPFWGVGAFYRDFHQLTDDEVVGLLTAEGQT